jgi:hypothetical protein
MPTLLEYIEQLKEKHEVRVKIACEVTDDMMDKIERHLQKYDAEKISSPSKTILQARPLDFPNMDMAEVYIIDFTACLPVSKETLHRELAKLLDISEGLVVVRGANDEREIEQEEEKFQDKKEDYKAKVGADYDKSEAPEQKVDELFGDKFNGSLLKELKKISDAKKKEVKTPKIAKDPDVPASAPEIGDSKETNKTSPVVKRNPLVVKGKEIMK